MQSSVEISRAGIWARMLIAVSQSFKLKFYFENLRMDTQTVYTVAFMFCCCCESFVWWCHF